MARSWSRPWTTCARTAPPATNELIFVLKKWADRANQMDDDSGVESGNEGDDDSPVKNEPRRPDMEVEEEELDEDEDGVGADEEEKGDRSDVKKEATKERTEPEEKDVSDISPASQKMTPTDSGRKSSKSAASPVTPERRTGGDKEEDGARGGKDKSGRGERGREKSSKTEDVEEAPSKVARPGSARSIDNSAASPSRAKAKWEKFDQATALGAFRSGFTPYLKAYPVDGVDIAELAKIVEKSIADKVGDHGKLYYTESKQVVLLLRAATHDKSAVGDAARKRALEFVKSKDPAHILSVE